MVEISKTENQSTYSPLPDESTEALRRLRRKQCRLDRALCLAERYAKEFDGTAMKSARAAWALAGSALIKYKLTYRSLYLEHAESWQVVALRDLSTVGV